MVSKLKFGLLLLGVLFATGFARHFSALSMDQVMQLVNEDRATRGLPALAPNPTLNLAAYAKAEDMISNHYFAHTSPEGISPWYWFKSLGYNYEYAGENLAIGYQNASDLVSSWMNSTSHRENILSPNYREMGLAIIPGQNSTLVVQLFGTQEPNKISYK